MDTRYRDMCVSGANQPASIYSPYTGEIQDIATEDDDLATSSGDMDAINNMTGNGYGPRPLSIYDQFYEGVVLGAKPPGVGGGRSIGSYDETIPLTRDNPSLMNGSGEGSGSGYGIIPLTKGAAHTSSNTSSGWGGGGGDYPPANTCMPIRDTAKINPVPSDATLAFAYYLNMDDTENYDSSLVTSRNPDIYGSYDFYKNVAFFMNGVVGCPGNQLVYVNPPAFNRDTIPQRLAFRQFQAEWCYRFFLLSHDTNPMFTMERIGIETRDPLSKPDPIRSYLNNCQPLVNGKDSMMIEFNATDKLTDRDKKSGFAPVFAYQLSGAGSNTSYDVMNEDEYLLSDIVQELWNNNFTMNGGNSIAANPLYKLQNPYPFPFPATDLPCIQNQFATLVPGSPPSPIGCSRHDSTADSCPPKYPLPNDFFSPLPKTTPYYCPNVEKITAPADNPYTPREKTYKPVQGDLKGTDRHYSDRTSICIPDPLLPSCSTTYVGYTDWSTIPSYPEGGLCASVYAPEGNAPSWIAPNEYPVECAIVPVDILTFRARAFHSCIMQRINFNLNTFVDDWLSWGIYPGYATELTHWDNTGWPNPCMTRFWENDNPCVCQLKLSIQQCCHMIIKDVVPANFIKFRAKEGLRYPRVSGCPVIWPTWGINPNAGGPYLNPSPSPDPLFGKPTDHVIDDWFTYIPAADMFSGGSTALQSAMYVTQELNMCGSGLNSEPADYLFSKYFEGYTQTPDPMDIFYNPEWPTTPWLCTFPPDCFLGYHMPYMRWWDTGVSDGNPRHGGSFTNVMGGFDTLIGVGREEITLRDQYVTSKLFQQAQNLPASGDDPDVGVWTPIDDGGGSGMVNPRTSQMGRIGGLPELYGHAMWSIRNDNDFCITRFEKGMKLGSAENFALAKAGSGYNSRGYNNPPAKKIVGSPWAWSLGWRGYITTPQVANQFPNLFSSSGAVSSSGALIQGGLDNALRGDIIWYTIPGLPPRIAFVTTTETDPGAGLNWVDVQFWDQGKLPTSAYSTIMSGIGPIRRIYKTEVPPQEQQTVCNYTLRALTAGTGYGGGSTTPYGGADYSGSTCSNAADDGLDPNTCIDLNCQPSCVDDDYHSCVLPNGLWSQVQIYRSSFDIEECTGTPTFTGGPAPLCGGSPCILNPLTYDFQIPLSSIGVILQNESSLVDANMWAKCVADGTDPPPSWSSNNEYNGNLTGQKLQIFFCAPFWGNCSQEGNVGFY